MNAHELIGKSCSFAWNGETCKGIITRVLGEIAPTPTIHTVSVMPNEGGIMTEYPWNTEPVALELATGEIVL